MRVDWGMTSLCQVRFSQSVGVVFSHVCKPINTSWLDPWCGRCHTMWGVGKFARSSPEHPAAMSSDKPYIGCKIGLISRAQNRYEGILYTIDKVNSTVVLAKGECWRAWHIQIWLSLCTLFSNVVFSPVKCFGTEGRPTDRPTPPKDDVYEYITFRGSDIKDITLCELPRSHHGLPADPAIIQVY